MADIQDWVFFHGWEILIVGKIFSIYLISRFLGILSSERRPYIKLYLYRRGHIKKDIFVAIVIFFLGIIFVGMPKYSEKNSFDFYHLIISFLGQCVFYGTEVILLLGLNEFLPMKRKSWRIQIVVFSLISFIFHKSIFLYGISWESNIIAFFALIFYSLRLRGEFGWFHPLLVILFLIAPLSSFFGLDPIWGKRFSLFYFSNQISGLEVTVFAIIFLLYFKRNNVKFLG